MPLFSFPLKKVTVRVGQTRIDPPPPIRNFVLLPSVIKLPEKSRIMLHQISWLNYLSAVIIVATAYYAYVILNFYKSELQALICRLSGRRPVSSQSSTTDFQIPDFSVAGAIKPEEVDFVLQEELSFGPPDDADLSEAPNTLPLTETKGTDILLVSDFSEMISEVKTLIRVINESSETKENFEMLFRLVVQKYYALAGTPYEEQVNNFLLTEGASQFPFSLTINELESYWINEPVKN